MAPRGRPKTFERGAALDAAILLFWNRGFEQTSVDEVAAAMGIQTSSLYASFGDKEALFLEALNYYQARKSSIYGAAVNEGKTAKEGFENLFKLAVWEMTRLDQPRGCVLALALPTCSPKYEKLQEEVNSIRDFSEEAWVKRLRAALKSGELPKETNLRAIQLFFRNTLWGMSMQARAGASRESLMEIARMALQVWPAPHQPSYSDRHSS